MQDQNDSEKDGTRVDLGEDLLEKTAILVNSQAAPKGPDLQNTDRVSELLGNAKILFNEGLVEDAKKILHQILIVDPSNLTAKKQLSTINELQMNKLLRSSENEKAGPKRSLKGGEAEAAHLESEEILRKLDQDLQLGVFSEDQPVALVNQLSLFRDSVELDAFCDRLENDLAQSSTQDWIDLGIAFLEIDLYPIAIRLFSGACRSLNPDVADYVQKAVSATSLLALALYLWGKPYEAISRIQPMLMNIDIRSEDKTELYYLIGRIYESLKKPELASKFYENVRKIDPFYRDVAERL